MNVLPRVPMLSCITAMVVLFSGCGSPTADRNFFNYHDLSGWKASQMQYWSVQDSAIVGKADNEVDRNQFLWSDIKVKDFYLSLDVKLDSPDCNAGIQFRSQKINDYGQALGYQADIGLNYGVNIWGTLYHEHGRGLLQTSDPALTIVRDRQWNHYEILASGEKIWIAVNGRIISAVEDPRGEKEGYIAFQIHAGTPQTVSYKINRLIHNPAIVLAGKNETELNELLHRPLVPAPGVNAMKITGGATIAFAGGTNVVNMMNDGYLETLLTAYFPKSALKFRNVAWEGDQVNEQFRDVGFGGWKKNIDSLNPDIVMVQFGQMEALKGADSLRSFIQAYTSLLRSIQREGRQIIVLSPIDFEPSVLQVNDSAQANNPLAKSSMQSYFNAVQLMAQSEGYPFVDLYYNLRPKRTYDGIHLNDYGQQMAAQAIMRSLGMEKEYTKDLDPLRGQINIKNRIWFDYWRPGNWAFLNGDRTEQAFSRHWKNTSNRIFPEEIKKYAPLLEAEEKKIAQMQQELSNGKTLSPADTVKITPPPPVPLNDHSVEDELASFKLNKNYNIELYASEALGIADPVTMRWDERGRLWVLCAPTYPQPLPGQSANDRLMVLEDRNKDGKADTSYLFTDGLDIPLGFELGHGGVFLGEQTRLLFLKDTNNDLHCDSRQTVLSGFGTHDSHQTINSFTWSPGGELFFSHGLSIHSYVETPWGVKKAHRGAIWRYRPLLHQLDNILDQSTASDNPWGMTFGDWGELFSKSNDTGIYYTSPALALSEHKSLVPEIGATQIKSGIVEIPRSAHLPEDIRNDILVAGYYNNKIERFKLKEKGAGFKATLSEPLLASVSKNFRPVDIKTGPDGAIYILDWYNPIIGHYQASLRDPQRDKTHGRVWRITAKNRALVPMPDLVNKPVAVLLEHLKSQEYWVRYQVRRLLAAHSSNEVLPALDKWVAALHASDEKYLMEALAVYETFETVNEPLLKRLLQAKNPGARAYAAQVTGRWSDRLPSPLSCIAPLINDRNARVRMMALVACSQIHLPESMILAARVLRYPMDKFSMHAFEKTVFALRDSWEPAFKNKSISFDNNEQLASVVSILTPEWYTAKMYRDLLGKGTYSADITRKLLTQLCAVGSPEDIAYVMAMPFTANNSSLLNEVAKQEVRNITPGTVASIKKILNDAKAEELIVSAIRLVKSWNIVSLSPAITKITISHDGSDKIVSQGIAALVSLKASNAMAIADKFYSGNPSRTVRMACINGYAKLDMKRGAAETAKEMRRGSGDVNEMRETVIAIIYEPGGIAALSDEISRSGLGANQASAALVALDQRHISDKALLANIARFESKTSVPKEYDESFVSRLSAGIKNDGNGRNGERVYREKLACSACHTINNKGGNIGPNLSSVGSGLSVSDILTEVLWPNKNIKEGYYSVRLELKNGEAVQGIRVLENAAIISVKNTPSSSPVAYKKSEIEMIIPIGSAMPEGLGNTISEDELRDVVKFLSEQRNK